MNSAISPFFFKNKQQAGNNFNLHKTKKTSQNAAQNAYKLQKSSLVNRQSKTAREMLEKSSHRCAAFMRLPWDGSLPYFFQITHHFFVFLPTQRWHPALMLRGNTTINQ